MKYPAFIILLLLLVYSCRPKQTFDTIIRNALIYDGTGASPYRGDIGINRDTIAAIGDLSTAIAKNTVDAAGQAVAPGFINMLSWANDALMVDGRSLGDIRQGVTLEVMGEGWSMGPYTPEMKKQEQEEQTDLKYPVTWNTVGGYLTQLEKNGISCNVASFVGATTIRQYVLGEKNIQPDAAQLDSMRRLVEEAMKEGAMGVGSSLIYPPAFFAGTQELIEMSKVAGRYGGSYISHIRSEGNRLHEAVEELITIAREANVHAEIYHLKAAGRSNWNKIDSVINRINRARKEGVDVTADMYMYTAGGTGLTATMPPSLQDGGFGALRKRLMDPVIRKNLKQQMNSDTGNWENFFKAVGNPENILLVGFKQDSLKKFTGKTLAEVASIRKTSPEEVAMDLIIQDSTRVETIYFMMDEQNLEKQVRLPWMSFGSDEGSYSPEGDFLKFNVHPRAYGNFARLLGSYVRDKKLLTLEEAVRKLTSLPAGNLKIKNRGVLKPGFFADVVVFDPATITDQATFEKPHQLASGVNHVFVNGIQVLKDGNHTGAKPGRFIKGPGYLSPASKN